MNEATLFFANLKALLGTAAAQIATSLGETIGTALNAFSPPECANHLKNSGYSV
jgi:Ca2+/H+ antiporter